MKLHLEFDADLIRTYVNRGASPVFTIYWTQDQMSYPGNQWIDFGSVVLSWWLVAAKSLVEGALEAEFLFMDGPYCLNARRFGNQLHLSAEGEALLWHVSTETFVTELLKAAYEVKQKFAELNISDKAGLQVGTRSLEIAISEARKVDRVGNILVRQV